MPGKARKAVPKPEHEAVATRRRDVALSYLSYPGGYPTFAVDDDGTPALLICATDEKLNPVSILVSFDRITEARAQKLLRATDDRLR